MLFLSKNRKKYNYFAKIISMFLTISIIVVSLPIVTFASELNISEIQPYVLLELEEYRDFNTKQFLMSDNTIKAIVYNEPVHYFENGRWQNIDNSLEYEDKSSTEDINGYKTKNGEFSVKFAKKSNSSKLVTIKKDKYSLSWNLLNKNKIYSLLNNAEIVKNILSDNDDIFETSVINTTQVVNYNNIIDNTNLQYVVNGNGLKENIIVNGKSDEYKYTFEIKSNNLILELQEDNNIIAYAKDTEEIIYTIPSMYMYDKSGAYSDAISVSLSQKNNKYVLEITADQEWINSEERNFPVVIDPQITTEQIKKYIDSTYVESGHSSKNHNCENQMMVGKDSSGIGKSRGFNGLFS